MQNLETPRLSLRPIKPEEAAAYHAFTTHKNYLRFMPFASSSEQEMKTALILLQKNNRKKKQSSWSYSIYLIETNELIGNILITRDDYPWGGIARIGYGIDTIFWNKGYLTEALQCATEFAHSYLGFHRITARCHVDNIGSWRALEKCGFIREGILHYAQYNIRTDEWEAESFTYASVRPELIEKGKSYD